MMASMSLSRTLAGLSVAFTAFFVSALPVLAQDDDGTIEFAPGDDEFPTPPPAPRVNASPGGGAPAASEPAPNYDSGELKIRVRKPALPRVFGSYRVRVSGEQPTFDDGLDFYKEAYGSPKNYPMFAADWFAWDWYATLGLSFRMGYYTADGYALKSTTTGKEKKDLTADDVTKDKNGPTSLTLVPLQVALTAEMTPFTGKWIVLDGWVGIERLYWQEVRTGGSSSTSTTTPTKSTTAATGAKDDSLTNKGWKNGTTVGVSANILLNPLDEEGATSMRGVMGLGYIYASPYVEIVRMTNKDGVSFGRKIFGLGFTFETVR